MNTKTLDIIFDTVEQKPVRLSLPKIEHNVTKELVVTEADKMIKSNVLSLLGAQVIQVKTAQLTDKTVTVLF
ncbi:DUF2922 domain-containing protein [Staphylococcus americanisciuri]|uniref:DUF2922 domain-containing protein n=1 Tax=Staphylococcus americanisciuri TaxID=2973940 RepID=A0ABT2F2K5_9STAP|nr:DUF2922 domain-containing protein [Staphylococcus americanisciuri]MCS4486506.1 DUF2922 domain-containing protein [Staphylococcus americanisciuri]